MRWTRAEAGAWQDGVGDADAARAVLRELAARPEFRPPEPPMLERFLEWLFALWPDGVGGPLEGVDPTFLGWLLLALIVVALLAGATLALRVLLRDRRAARRAPARVEPASAPAEDLDAADAHWRAGRRRAAFAALYGAGVAALAGRGLVRAAPSKLAGAYRRELGARPERDAFARLVEAAYAVLFGAREPGEPQYARARSDAAALAGGEPERAR